MRRVTSAGWSSGITPEHEGSQLIQARALKQARIRWVTLVTTSEVRRSKGESVARIGVITEFGVIDPSRQTGSSAITTASEVLAGFIEDHNFQLLTDLQENKKTTFGGTGLMRIQVGCPRITSEGKLSTYWREIEHSLNDL